MQACEQWTYIKNYWTFPSLDFSRTLFLGGLLGQQSWEVLNNLTIFTTFDSSAGCTVYTKIRQSQVQDVIILLGRPMGHFDMGVANSTCITNLSCGILVRWLNHDSWDLFIRRSSSTLLISQPCTLSPNVMNSWLKPYLCCLHLT